MKCSICKEEIKGDVVTDSEGLQKVVYEKGHSAYPVNNGRCCDNCNLRVVIPLRMSTNFLMLSNSTYGLLGHASAEERAKIGQEVLKELLNKRKMDKIEIITGLYKERNSKRCPLYTTEIKSELFGGTHYTLESLLKNLIKIPEVSVHRGTNAKEREEVAKRFKITIEKL